MKSHNTEELQRPTSEIAATQWRPGLDAQLSELIGTVYACERMWSREDRIGAAITYGRTTK